MFTSREYIGISLEGDHLRIARVRSQKNGVELVRLDKLRLVEPLKSKAVQKTAGAFANAGDDDPFPEEGGDDLDSIFGFDDEEEDDGGDEIEEIDLSDIDSDTDGFGDDDLVQQAGEPGSNEELLVQYLDDFGRKKVHLGLNIETGETIFQSVRGHDFHELKKKETEEIVYQKLEAVYSTPPHKDYYNYLIRRDGSLLIASLDEEAQTLQLATRASEMFGCSIHVEDVVPDEVAMAGLYRNHYPEEEDQITGLIQFGPEKSRIVFMRGHEILQIAPVINEGTSDRNYLNTIFSKILFQLDTGDIPGVDRFVLVNNSAGESATDFFRKNFPDVPTENFTYNPEKLSYSEELADIMPGYTTAISIAAHAAGAGRKAYPGLTFLPDYVSEKQKVFKLHWHGFVLLFLIGASPVLLNHFYQQNAAEIDRLTQQETRLETTITELQPLVDEAGELSFELGNMQDQLELLTDLSRDNIRWTVTLDRLNEAVAGVGGMWLNSFRQNNDVLMVDGYALRRDLIPDLANRFDSVTLLTVRKEELRERDIFYFNMMVRRVVEDETLFTPQQSADIEDLF